MSERSTSVVYEKCFSPYRRKFAFFVNGLVAEFCVPGNLGLGISRVAYSEDLSDLANMAATRASHLSYYALATFCKVIR